MKLKKAFFCAVFVLSCCSQASAQIFLEEGKVRLSAAPGETIAGSLTLHNRSDRSVTMKVYWEDFEYVEPFDGTKNFLPKGTTEMSVADWVNVPSRELQFGPFGKKSVPYTVNVPDDIRQGHYGVLFFEQDAVKAEGMAGLNIVARVGCLFFVEPKNKSKDIRLSNVRLDGQGMTAEMTSRGNVVVIPDGTFYIIDDEGMVFDRGAIAKVYLPPGKTADYALAFNRDLRPGRYTLVMTVGLEDDDVFVQEVDFEKGNSSSFNIVEIRD